MALPSLYTEGTTASNLPLNSLNNQYILELVLTAHIVQVMLLYDRSQDGEEGEGWVLGFYHLSISCGISLSQYSWNPD